MVTSVRMEPLLEKEIELAAKKLGVTKSQFIIDAVERALGRKNPFELMMRIKAEEAARADPAVEKAFRGYEQALRDSGFAQGAREAPERKAPCRQHWLIPAQWWRLSERVKRARGTMSNSSRWPLKSAGNW